MTTQEYLERRKSREWNFSNVIDISSFLNVRKIHPLKQKLVGQIVEAAREDEEVKRIIIFGSSARYDCDITSDLDICIDWRDECYDEEGVLKPFTNHMRRTISQVTKGKADVVNYGYLRGTDIEQSVRDGVLVYEHNV